MRATGVLVGLVLLAGGCGHEQAEPDPTAGDPLFRVPSDAMLPTYPREVRIPDGQYFLLGDNRGSSDDSRFWGPVPKGWILARVRK